MELSLIISFIAGLVSFLSPCVLPLIPGFLAYLAGSSLAESGTHRRQIFMTSVFFVLGFSAVFSVLGVLLNTLLEAVAYDVQIWLSRIGGGLIILFGLYLVGLIKIPFLEREIKFQVKTQFHLRYMTAFVFGAAFAAGWTPCVGAVLGGILGLAASAPGSALTLLFTYFLGLGLPFLAVGLFASQSSQLINKYAYLFKYVNIVFGVVLIGLGILAFTQQLSRVANLELLNKFLLR